MALKMTNREVDGVSVVALDGRIVLGEESNALREKVKSLIAEGKKKIVLITRRVAEARAPRQQVPGSTANHKAANRLRRVQQRGGSGRQLREINFRSPPQGSSVCVSGVADAVHSDAAQKFWIKIRGLLRHYFSRCRDAHGLFHVHGIQ